jgi:hypothetical protein
LVLNLKKQPEVQKIADRLWGDIDGVRIKENSVGQGKVVWGMTPSETLRSKGIEPDFGFSGTLNDSQLDYIHRTAGNKEIYFVVNRLARYGIYDTKYRYLTDLPDRYENIICKFRVTGKVPELWDPMTGEIKKIAVYKEDGAYIYLPLHLAPEASVFVVFKDQQPQKHIVEIQKDGKEIFPVASLPGSHFQAIECLNIEGKTLVRTSQSGTYKLKWSDGSEYSFNEENALSEYPVTSQMTLKFINPRGPSEPLKLETLQSWTDFSDKKVRYYSGSADYSTTFMINNDRITNKRIYLDLGNVQEIAEVWINDRHVGVSWIPPFVLDVTGYIKEGENTLTVSVVNSWTNRLIGDSYLPTEQRVTRTNIVKFEGKDKEELIRKSGLTGEVKVILVNEKILNPL